MEQTPREEKVDCRHGKKGLLGKACLASITYLLISHIENSGLAMLGTRTELGGSANRRRICARGGRCDGQMNDDHIKMDKLAAIVALRRKVWVVYHRKVQTIRPWSHTSEQPT